MARAPEFPPLPFASWRSEPQACNADGRIRLLLRRLPFATEDVLIVSATHCDPENPSDVLCGLACGCSTPSHQALYQQFLYLFVRNALQAPPLPNQPPDYETALDEAAAQGRVVIAPSGAPAQ
jgi:hypothetical protein